MISTTDFKRGARILVDGEPYTLEDYSVQTPSARGAATLVPCKLRHVVSGALLSKTFKSGEKFDEPDLETREVQFLYAEGETLHFMDLASYDQFAMARESVGGLARYLVDGQALKSVLFNGRVIGLDLPPFLEMEVVSVDASARGDTASGKVMKDARLVTGAEIKVPSYLDAGERVLVDTRTGEFVKRVNR